MEALTGAQFQATMLASTGGVRREGNSTIIIGVQDEQVDEVLTIIQKISHRREQLLSPMPPVVEPVDSYVTYPVKVEDGDGNGLGPGLDRRERAPAGKAAPRGGSPSGTTPTCASWTSPTASTWYRWGRTTKAKRFPSTRSAR